jgi:zinc transporter ZupT
MVCISSFSCILGASIVVILGDKKFISSKKFLSASMALGSGVLIFNSLYTLLPASQQKLNSNFITFTCFFIGVIFTILLTWLIQWCTPHAIHTCDPIATVQQREQSGTSSSSDSTIDELLINQPLLHDHKPNHHHHHRRESIIEYGSVLVTSEDIIDEERNDYFLIGMQTAIAICIHKFPG